MQEVFNELGYAFSWDVLNAKNYGIPQNRERLFVVGIRNDILLNEQFVFPEPIPLTKTMKDFLIYLKRRSLTFPRIRNALFQRTYYGSIFNS